MSKAIAPPQIPDEPEVGGLRARAARAYRLRKLAEIEAMDVARESERTHYYRSEGYGSTAEWLSTVWASGYMRTDELVEVALALESLPKLEAAYLQDRLSFDHLRAIVQVATNESEEELVEVFEGLTVAETFRRVAQLKKVTAEDSRDSRADRFLDKRWDREGRALEFRGRLPEEQGAIFEKAIDALASQIPSDPLSELQHRTPACAKRADALVEMAAGVIGEVGAKAQIVVHVEGSVVTDSEGWAEIEGGCVISPQTAKRLGCDSSIVGVLHTPDGAALSLGRSRRTVSPAQLRVLRKTYPTCAWKGCRRRNGLEAHHRVGWSGNGATDTDNLVLLCRHHHYQVEEGEFEIVGEPPKVKIVRPGRPPIQVGPPRLPGEG